MVCDAWRELHAVACAMRPDFDHVDWQGAILACRNAGVPFAGVAPVVWRLAWDTRTRAQDAAAEVRNLARGYRAPRPGHGLTREERDELRALAVGNCEAATQKFRHPTGPQPVLGPDPPRSGDPP